MYSTGLGISSNQAKVSATTLSLWCVEGPVDRGLLTVHAGLG